MNNEIRTQFGLTLVEILIVVAVIVILAAMIISIATRLDNQAKEKGMKNIFAILEEALLEYKDFKGDFPPATSSYPEINSEILYSELASVPASENIMRKISDKLIQDKYKPGAANPPRYEIYDLWGVVLDYRYITGDNFPQLISAGRDKSFGTPDDISNR